MPRKLASENVVCLCRLLNILANFSNLFLHTGKQCGPRPDCSEESVFFLFVFFVFFCFVFFFFVFVLKDYHLERRLYVKSID